MPEMENPAAGKRQGSKIVIRFAASDYLEPTLPTTSLQENYLVNRFGLAADRARLVASLAFGREMRS